MDEERLWQTLGKIEGTVSGIQAQLRSHMDEEHSNNVRLGHLERKMHTIWIFGGTAAGGAVLLAVEKMKHWLGL